MVIAVKRRNQYMAKRPLQTDLGVLPGGQFAKTTLAILYEIPQRSLHCVSLTCPQGLHGGGGVVVRAWLLVATSASVSAALPFEVGSFLQPLSS